MLSRRPHLLQPLMRLGLSLVPALAALALPLPLLSQTAQPSATSASSKGAEVYCFMRRSGNNHEVSWAAAYALIKRQSDSLFKTSPEHAAVMITEAVVKEPSAYPDCGQYLGALYGAEKAPEASPSQSSTGGAVPLPSSGTSRGGRYSY
ncbi:MULTISPECIES: DUF6554 family protein [Synechococcales]|uniref:DUF6554 family protein n=1 Tax=unclassified Synechococcus TaxID=2626047 RepID=UPI0021A59996|nr:MULTISPECIES: DUF6554 family protein [unclassified Synechococcus]